MTLTCTVSIYPEDVAPDVQIEDSRSLIRKVNSVFESINSPGWQFICDWKAVWTPHQANKSHNRELDL
jgi:hypothetical protein